MLEKLTKYSEVIFLIAFTTTALFASTPHRTETRPGNEGTKSDSTLSDKAISTPVSANLDSSANQLFNELALANAGLGLETFQLARRGWEKLKEENRINNQYLLSIADFSQPSTQKRLYIIDMKNRKLLYHTYVAHGRNSGREQATDFSNNPRSNMSSPGFYRTENTYYGNNGYSLRLEGLEKGINDNAGPRAIVMHGAGYVNESMIRNQGYLGRSQGCPAIPPKLTRPIINTIKNGSCLFIYAPVTYYAERSTLVK